MTINIKNNIRKLINKIRYYDYMYYVKNTSVISDTDYDLLRDELESLEKKYPDLIENDSPTQNVGFCTKADHLIIRKHLVPMLSLRNTYALEDIIKFINSEDLWPVIVEPKIDGISLSLTYMDSYLSHGLLRGDGKEGEDIIDILIYIKDIPMLLKHNINCIIRGELYIKKEDFILLNQYRISKGEKTFQNSRNATSGIIRYKGKDGNLYSYISFIPYSIFNIENLKYLYNSQQETLEKLKTFGFNEQIYQIVNDESNLYIAIKNLVSLTEKTQDIDGLVIKTNDLIKMDKLGLTNHHPLGAIAYKFTNKTKETKIEKIIWQNSRNGKLTPIGIISPIVLDNANITRITLHNKKYLREKNISIGAILLIERVGSTVPQVKKVIKTTKNMEILLECGDCHEKILEDDVNYLCPNINCTPRIIESLLYFCQTMKMKGLGKESVKILISYVKKPSELINFIFNVPNVNVIGWEKFRFNFLKEFHKIDLPTILISLGPDNLSHQGISHIINHLNIESFENFLIFLQKDNYEEIILSVKIFSIGNQKINSFIYFLKNNKDEILKIIEIIKFNKKY